MCGICGIVEAAGLAPGDAARARVMTRLLEHRGPDGEGFWDADGAVLGHRRLAIIDIEGGTQPLFDESGRVGVVFNGEIYNFQELRRVLRSHGHRFRSGTDTEVIVHGYEQWGDDVVRKLRGMFAFALWDSGRRRLLLARDRLGIKPLYYATSPDGRRVIFASEIKALFADEDTTPALNEDRLAEYLAFRCVAGEETLFKGIRELPPGSTLVVDDCGTRTRSYWSPDVDTGDRSDPDDSQIEGARALLREVVSSHLMSDVGVGTITSGGLDSSLISALAAETLTGIDTFCVGFDDPALDERAEARAVADHIGSRHHDILADPRRFSEELERLTWFNDEPLTHPNAVPMYLVFAFARDDIGVPVLLSGEGADELFGGYAWYRLLYLRERLRRIPGLSTAASVLPGGRAATLARVLDREYPLWANAVCRPAQLRALGVDPLTAVTGGRGGVPVSLDGCFIHDQRTYLPPLLQRQDRMSMAVGLEARVPYLDHVFVEWANGTTATAKLEGGIRKRLLRKIARGVLPAAVIDRRKIGFALPLGEWLSGNGPLAMRVAELRAGEGTASDLARLAFSRGSEPTADMLWSLIALQLWEAVFLGSGSAAPWRQPPPAHLSSRFVAGR